MGGFLQYLQQERKTCEVCVRTR